MTDRLRDLDERAGRLGRTRAARVAGWTLVTGWVAVVSLELFGHMIR